MEQWTNLQRIKKFVNPIAYEKSGSLHLVKLSLTTGRQEERQTGRKKGRQAGRKAGRQEERQLGRLKFWVRFEILKACSRSKHSIMRFFNNGKLHCLNIFDTFLALFSGKHYYKVVL